MTDQAPEQLPYGSWPSPITAARLVEGAAAVGEIRADGEDVWWNEQRPDEGGRYQIVRRTASGKRHDLLPDWDASADASWNARTAVMEYGGGAWAVRDGTVVFANWDDQRLYRVDPSGEPKPITPEPSIRRGLRWSEPTWVDDTWLVCVRESHEPEIVEAHGEAVNELVAVPIDGSGTEDPSRVRVLVSGPDFVQSPAVSITAGGRTRVAWLQWDHPRMPWDGTELRMATLDVDGDRAPTGLSNIVLVAGGPEESVVQPGFLAGGDLLFCTDRTGWWNPWRARAEHLHAITPDKGPLSTTPVIADGGIEAEIGGGLWVGGLRWWAETSSGAIVASATADGTDRLVVIDDGGELTRLDSPFSEISQVVAGPDDQILVVAGSPIAEAAPYGLRIFARREDELGGNDPAVSDPGGRAPTILMDRLRPPRDLGVDQAWFSRPQHISFATAEGRTAHALHYAPHHREVTPTPGTKAPLVVMVHGGPTSAARHRLDLAKQFWTTRGFAVVDVNYGGSTGYGRPYRDLLQGSWGVVDVADAVAAARHLADEGQVDADRLAIRGGSAGGYTTLAALCFHDIFAAGASHYGVADLAALATETHKFESRYLDGLVGPWPEAEATYAERSPIRHTDGFDVPLIVLQGSEDEVVPPNQAEMIVDALAAKGVPHAYLLFEGEQHGFRRAENIVRALEAELWFYGRVFGFEPADAIDPVEGAVGL